MSAPFHQLVDHLQESGKAAAFSSSEEEESSIASVREWIRQQLDLLPETGLNAKLCVRLQARPPDPAAVLELAQLLQQRPEAVRLDECAARRSPLLVLILSLSEKHLRSFEPSIDALTSRIAAMDPRAMLATTNPRVGRFPAVALFSSHLLSLAADVAPGTSFDRFAGALMDHALAALASQPGGPAGQVDSWFRELAVAAGARHKVSWRGVRRGLELLASRGFALEQGTGFVAELVEAVDPRGWIAEYQGTERYEATAMVQRAVRASTYPFGTVALEAHADIAAQFAQWSEVHWPSIRADLEVRMIPDLASIVLGYLRPPPSDDAAATEPPSKRQRIDP